MKKTSTLLLSHIIFFGISISIVFGQATQSANSNSGIDPANIDNTTSPVIDFYQYSSGSWLANNPIPPEYSRWGSWNEIISRNEEVLKDILTEASTTPQQPGGLKQKLGDLYFSAMDLETIEKAGISPLNEDFARIDAVQNKEDFIKEFSYLKGFRNGGLFHLWGGQDDKNSENVILNIFQGGLGLPDRDYYLKDDEKSKNLKEQYVKFVAKMFALIGNDEKTADDIANRLMDLETRLAKSSMSRVDMREAEATYHLMTLSELKALTPDFNWDVLFAEIGLTEPGIFDKGINVAQPDYLKAVNGLLTDVSIDDWKNYLKWNLVRSAADFLSSDFANADFDFYSKTLRGVEKRHPRWKESLNFVEIAMGEPLGQLFVEKRFTPETKARALEMVNNIKESFRERLVNNSWMSDATKQEGLKKLSAFNVKIGYTDKWKDYSGLEIDRSSLVNNMKNASKYNFRLNLDKIAKPVDKSEWGMFPQTVNAYYNSSKNEIVFPAGIMQPPFYDPNVDDAVNYGGIGAVIGHEITHGFDDQGRKYDADGNMKDWWTEDDAKKFKDRADKLVKQYNSYIAIDSLHVNGELTLGENIADLGGLIVSYYAFKKAMEGKDMTPIDGFTPEQRFFLSYAQVWRANARPESLRLQINTDPHSPGKFRVIGVIQNMVEFMEAFNGKPGDPMVNTEEDRVLIW